MQFKTKKWSKQNRKVWTPTEDKLLQELVSLHGTKWIIISKALTDRNPSQCAQRWKRTKPNQTSQSRKSWSKDEDDQLISLYCQNGSNWKKISERFVDRHPKSLRERYVNHLATQINKEQFSKEEDDYIYRRYLELGPKWTQISKELQHRSENQVKNRFHHQIKPAYLNDKHSYYKLSSQVDKTITQVSTNFDPCPQTFEPENENSCNEFYIDNAYDSMWLSYRMDETQI